MGPVPHDGSDAGGVPGACGWLWGGWGSSIHISCEARRCSHAHVRPFLRPAPPLRDFSLLSKPLSLPPRGMDGRMDTGTYQTPPACPLPPSLH